MEGHFFEAAVFRCCWGWPFSSGSVPVGWGGKKHSTLAFAKLDSDVTWSMRGKPGGICWIFYGVWAMKSSTTTTQVLCCISLSQWLTWLFRVYAGLYYHILLSYICIYLYMRIIMIHHYKDPYIKHPLFATPVFFSWFYTWRKSSEDSPWKRRFGDLLNFSTWGVNFIVYQWTKNSPQIVHYYGLDPTPRKEWQIKV